MEPITPTFKSPPRHSLRKGDRVIYRVNKSTVVEAEVVSVGHGCAMTAPVKLRWEWSDDHSSGEATAKPFELFRVEPSDVPVEIEPEIEVEVTIVRDVVQYARFTMTVPEPDANTASDLVQDEASRLISEGLVEWEEEDEEDQDEFIIDSVRLL